LAYDEDILMSLFFGLKKVGIQKKRWKNSYIYVVVLEGYTDFSK